MPGWLSARPLTPELRAVLAAFALLALTAGVLLFPLAEETDRFFSWTILPPLTAAFLGAAYWAACVLIGWSARQDTWEEAAPALVPVTTIAVLLLAATLIHLDKFDLDSVFGWFWLIVYCGVPVLLAVVVWRQSSVPPVPVPDESSQRIPGILRGLLAWQAVVMGAIGVALWVAPTTEDSLWPWTLTPLTGRAVGSFLIGFAAAAAFAAWDNRLLRFRGAPTRTRRWARSSCWRPRFSARTSTVGARRRRTWRSPPACWSWAWRGHSPPAARSAASACSRS